MGAPPVVDIYVGVTAIGIAIAAGAAVFAVVLFCVWLSELVL